ncbi:MAG: hypothetical protein OEZ58_01570 [Gammaproteobacteria bacterium]|nr:hypothetical protein [Gammaproteobacteria bacterium]MDH5727650.1 hypothetical protein [Gammaproteobacteria bacterium]
MESSIVRFNTLVGVSLDFTYVNTNSKIRIRLPYANNIFLNIYSQLVGRHSIDYSYSKLGIQSKTCCWGIVPYASLGREDAFLTYANFVAVGIDIRLWEHYRISLETMQKWVFPNLTNSSSSQKGISWSFAFLAF